MRHTRRAIVLAGLVASILVAACFGRPASPQQPVKFSLDWKFEGPAAPFTVALDKGYFKAEGLDVTIDTSPGSLEPINRVASGAYDIGFGDINSLIKFRDANTNTPIKAVFMLYNRPAFSIVARKSRGITKPKDLEGKKLGAPAADGAYAQWKIFVQANNMDASKVTIENIGFPVRALVKGIKDTVKDPDAAVDTVLKRNDVASKPVELERLRMAIHDNILTPEVNADGYGAVRMDRLAQSIDRIALTYDFKNGKPKGPEVFDASFLPPAAERKVN